MTEEQKDAVRFELTLTGRHLEQGDLALVRLGLVYALAEVDRFYDHENPPLAHGVAVLSVGELVDAGVLSLD